MIRVMFICHGNICRSTMAESVFADMVKKRGRERDFVIGSAATSTEEIGNPPHYGTVRKLEEKGIALVPHRAVRLRKADFEKYDFFIGMDGANLRNMEKILGGKSGKIRALLSFAGESGEIADPWYTGDFEATYRDVIRGLEGFWDFLEREMPKPR
ncbi:MAG: low molecular weight protein-tyrosine-phosphatase [Peptostreptococcaceae bacterium]|nr:low molecular weight protein-tyrosine-phosphatase [Peptostreptococcaceae bacterium]